MTRLAAIAFALVVLLISVSAYIRLAQGGLGCMPWPACYALVGDAPQSFPITAAVHRLSASAIGVLALLFTIGAWRQGKQRGMSTAILTVTVLLAILGVRSGGLLLPAVVLGNYFGGLVLATLLGWLLIRPGAIGGASRGAIGRLPAAVRAAVMMMLLLAAATLATGIGSSAFHGNAACAALFDCGAPQPPTRLAVFTPLMLDAAGRAITPDGAGTLQWLHRLSGAAMTVAFAGLMLAMRSRYRVRPTLIAGLLVAAGATATGLIAIRHGVPIGVAVIHSLSGLFVVLVLLRLPRGT